MARPMLSVVTLAILALAPLARAAEPAVPSALESWRDWALDGRAHLQCPFWVSGPHGSADRHPCAWPSRLELAVTADGGRFALAWTAYADTWLPLPGSDDHWPLEVALDGAAAPVVRREDGPAVWAKRGDHRVSGRLRWSRRPEALAVPPAVALVDLSVDGKAIFPLQRAGASLWLGRAEAASTQADALAVEVYRLLSDGLPALLETRLRLNVSGQGREVVIGPVLPAGFAAVAVTSDLQVMLDADSRARVQLRPGQWQVVVTARAEAPLAEVAMAARPAPWPEREIWSYQAAPRLRVTAADGGLAVDPSQVNVPAEWAQLPAASVAAGDILAVEERSRGMAADANRLHLARELWLDFAGRGMTARDRITGRMVRGFRLDLTPPYVLSRAQADGQPVLVTAGGGEGSTGVELRNPAVDLEATSRHEEAGGSLAVTGWSESFESVATTLHLPPGRELVAAVGADSSPEAWVDRWSLLDVFLVLITTALAYRLLGWRLAAVAGAFLALSYHETPGPLWAVLVVLCLTLIARALPAGRLARATEAALLAAAVVLALVALPFVAGQLRLALYPQLERAEVSAWSSSGRGDYDGFVGDDEMPASPEQMMVQEAQDKAESRLNMAAAPLPQRQAAKRLERYAASNVFQAGGGEPAWSWRQARLAWSGPVLPTQRVRLVVTPVWLTRVLRVLMVGLLAALLVALARAVRPRPYGAEEPMPAVTMAVPLALALLLAPAPSAAQATPDPALLAELGQRLARAPACVPACGHLEQTTVSAAGDRLELALIVHAAAFVAVPLPSSPTAWDLVAVTVDGRPRDAVLAADGAMWLALERGVHRVVLAGRLAGVDAAEITFPLRPARVEARATGWDLSGVRDGALVTDTLTLVRVRGAQAVASGPEVAAAMVAPFVVVHRSLDLDLDWTVTTTVTRLAPTTGSYAVEVPLLDGESVLTPGFEVTSGRVTAALPAGVDATSWQSRLEPSDHLALVAPDLVERAELWQVAVSPQWRAVFTGPPPTYADESEGFWVHEVHPLPGEVLEIAVTRPQPVAGATLAVDAATLTTQAGRRAREHQLDLTLRSTRGGQHALRLPAASEVLEVSLDGTVLNLRPDAAGTLTVPVHPGEQRLALRFRDQAGDGWWLRSPVVDLGASASNLRVVVNLAASRWVVWTAGPRVGPAVLYWGELAVMLLVAAILARLGRTPLRVHHWVLLGLGFSTFSWLALVVVVGWLLALDWRPQLVRKLGWWRFDLLQLALVGLTVAALGCLVVAIPYGLLGAPDLHVVGNGSSAHSLAWFEDLSDGPLPTPTAVSLPLWTYRVVMLAWALWLATAVVGWLRWGWQCLTAGGGWQPAPKKAKPSAAPPSPAAEPESVE